MLDPAALAAPHRFRETYDPWTGRAWLSVLGPEPQRVRIGAGYGALRRALRERFPDRPFDTDWADGRYWPAPWGLPVGPVVALAAVAAVGGVCLASAVGGPWAAAGLAALVGWPLLRLLDGVDIRAEGLRVGPPWASRVPWYHVERVGIVGNTVWIRAKHGGASGTVPRVLIPAVRARLRRQSGLAVDAAGGLDQRYDGWRAAATGIPWGVGLAVAVAAWFTTDPWAFLNGGGAVTLGLALLGAAVHARATGWGTGAIAFLTGLYAFVALMLALATL